MFKVIIEFEVLKIYDIFYMCEFLGYKSVNLLIFDLLLLLLIII